MIPAMLNWVRRTIAVENTFSESEKKSSFSFEHYYDLFFHASEAICFLDTEGNFIEVNAAAEKLTGYFRDELLLMNVRDIVHPDDKEKSAEYFRKLIHQGFYENYRGRLIDRSGSIKHIEVNSKVFFEDAAVVGSRDVIRDISRHVKLEEELKNKADQLQKTYHELQAASKLMIDDLALARDIQQKLMPDPGKFIDLPVGSQLAVRYLPVNQVGGDIYDLVYLSHNRFRLFLADATGHGVQGALVTMLIRSEYNLLRKKGIAPDQLLKRLNDSFSRQFADLSLIFTAVAVDIDFATKEISYSSAGHPLQFLTCDGKTRTLKTHGKPIGIIENIEYELKKLKYEQNFSVLLFSDGYSEAQNAEKEEFSERRILEYFSAVSELPAAQVLTGLHQKVISFCAGAGFHDDITAIALSYQPAHTNDEELNDHSKESF